MTINIDPDDLIGVGEAARLMNVSPREVRRKIQRGTLPATMYGREYAINKHAVTFYLRARKIKKQTRKNKPKNKRSSVRFKPSI